MHQPTVACDTCQSPVIPGEHAPTCPTLKVDSTDWVLTENWTREALGSSIASVFVAPAQIYSYPAAFLGTARVSLGDQPLYLTLRTLLI